ncbi:LPS export ABC transporter permease LptG [Tateyamaria pelophila]|uniref:LPS export ABC transporter permease LptG n=1 Tax=Tateyamaria pelophila TaxID=328415 RepID=UPI001CC10F7A|nr:LPS export ABC transporter permease LptG [Tateyamaria pelophila]
MRVLIGYFGWVLGVRILSVLLAFAALLVLMDLIDNIEDILERRGSVADVVLFAGYRVPTIVERLIPLSVLIGSTMGILALANHSELIVLRATGMSPLRIAALGIPACLMVVLGHFILADRVAPASQQAFIEWWEPLLNRGGTQWLRGEDNLVRISEVSRDGQTLMGLSFFERDEAGRLIARVTATTAKFEGSEWQLYDAAETILSQTSSETIKTAVKPWPGGPDPQVILDLIARPEQLSKGTLGQVLSVDWSSSADPSVYSTELARRSVGPLTSLVMMLIAASTIRGMSRSGGPQLGAALALVLGLTFLVVDGMFASLGKAGVLGPTFAAWTPLFIFTGISAFFLFRFER